MLTEEQRTAVIKTLSPKLRVCPTCGANRWAVVDLVAIPVTVSEGGRVVPGGPQLPAVSVACVECGMLLFFSARSIGIVEAVVEDGERKHRKP